MATPRTLDRVDRALLLALQEDGRRSNKELAALVGLAPSSCLERVRRLQQKGHLRAVRAEVNPTALGVGLQAMVFVQLDNHSGDTLRAYRDRLASLDAVVAAYHVTGRHDFVVHLVARDADHLRDLILDGIGHRDVRHVETALIFEQHRAPRLPDYTLDADADADPPDPPDAPDAPRIR